MELRINFDLYLMLMKGIDTGGSKDKTIVETSAEVVTMRYPKLLLVFVGICCGDSNICQFLVFPNTRYLSELLDWLRWNHK